MHVIPVRFQMKMLRRMREAPDRHLRSFFRMGGDMVRGEILRQVGIRRVRDWRVTLISSLTDSNPAIRKNAAFALGLHGDPDAKQTLIVHSETERCDTVRFHMLLAARRCGSHDKAVRRIVDRYAQRRVFGAYGSRQTGGIAGWPIEEITAIFELLGIRGTEHADSVGALREHARATLRVDGDDYMSVLRLGALGHSDDVPLLERTWKTAGRRMRLVLCKAMGLHGSPLFFPRLVDALTSVDVDPGHGFALRAGAAVSIGRLGFKGGVRVLSHALEAEALDYEGRPGSGLGIQRSVRTALIAALGELQCMPKILVPYLGNIHGSAHGGFYLPAMDALWKIGSAGPLYPLMNQSDLVAANALGTIRAIVGPQAGLRWADDPRDLVSAVANAQSV